MNGVVNGAGMPEPARGTERRTSLGSERRPQSQVIEDAPDDSRILDQRKKRGESVWGRPVDIEVMPDGSLLVSDDHAGAIYRIAYRGTR